MFNWWKRNKSDKEWQQFHKQAQEHFQQWIQTHEEAKNFTSMKCHFCQTPAPNREANFCSNCGASFHAQPGQHHDTEPLQVSVGEPRPYESYHRQIQQISEQDTQQVSAARPVGIKRTVRIPRLERLA
jgi:hypothetical protein